LTDDQKIEAGFHLIDYLKEVQSSKINGPDNRLSVHITNANLKLEEQFNQIEHKKLKLFYSNYKFILEACSGVGLETNIESWAQK
jgi:hypothetical protein